jgi:hypothetical protein
MSFMVKFDGLFHPSSHDGTKEEDHHQDEKDNSPQKKPIFFSLYLGRNQSDPPIQFLKLNTWLPPSFTHEDKPLQSVP